MGRKRLKSEQREAQGESAKVQRVDAKGAALPQHVEAARATQDLLASTAPFSLVHRTSLCGFQPSELIGRPLQLGKAGGVSAAVRLAEGALEAHGSYSSTIISQSKSGRPFLQHLQARKVTEEGRTCEHAHHRCHASSTT